MKKLRPCVVGVFVDPKGHVLVGKRSNSSAWQFPQGGVDPGESSIEALYREMEEEIGCNQFDIIKEVDEKISYLFPESLKAPIAKKYKGQEQSWFLCQFHKNQKACLEEATDDEFVELKWVKPDWVMQQVIEFKKDAYLNGLKGLDILNGGQDG